MSRHHKPKAFWRLARIWFRHVRITVWLLILLLLLALVYLHYIGLPGFAQRAVIGAFAARGITLSFSQLHLSWIQGIVAEEVSLQPAGSGWVPRIECQKVDLNFDPLEALRLRIVPESLSITEGQLILPYPQTNGLPGRLTATHLQARIRFEPGVGMALDSLQGEVAGCNFSASGTAANLHRIQDWRLLQQRVDQQRGPAYEIWQTVSRIRNDIMCLTPPEVRVEFALDGAAPERLALRASLTVDAATSPLGMLENPEVTVRVNPMDDGTCSEVEILAQADRIVSEFGRGENVILESAFSCVAEEGTLLAGRTALTAHKVDTLWAGAVDLQASVGWSCDGTNPIPVAAELDLGATELSTPSAWARGVRVGLRLTPFLGDHRRIPELPQFIFAELEPFAFDGTFKTERVETPWLSLTNLEFAGSWSAPELAVTNLSVECAGGHLEAGVEFDAASGRLQFRAFTDLDPKRFYPVLPQAAVDWLEFFTYDQAPVANGAGAITFPEWRPYELRWPGNLLPSLVLQGEFSVGEGTYRRIPLSGASSHFTYSNMCWHLPDLTLRRPDGALRLEHHNNDRTSEFSWQVNGAMDPTPALILIPEAALATREVLNTLHFAAPPEVHLTLSGCWNDANTLKAWGTVHATDLAFRGQSMEELNARVGLTNLTLTITEPHVKTSQGEAGASSLTFNLLENRAFLSNGVSTLPPMVVATAIGSDVVRAIEPYRFLNPPNSRVDGFIPLTGAAEADLRFDLKGGPFEWMTFELSEVDARVHWKGDTVAIDIRRAGFYDGTASGQAFFDFTQTKDADFHFTLSVNDADMRPLVAGVFQSTNQLEGRLSGGLSVTNANTGDFQSWFGYGHATLRDGFLWSVPIFGIVSPILEVFVPGLGNSRAKEAEGRFTITNSVIRTDDLVIHCSNMRLLYTGTVDFQGQVEAVAEAEILRDTLVVGEIVSLALTPLSKALIIEITGTLSDPKARPFYLLPRIILAPLSPVRFFRDMFAPPAPNYKELPPPAPGDEEMAPPQQPPAP